MFLNFQKSIFLILITTFLYITFLVNPLLAQSKSNRIEKDISINMFNKNNIGKRFFTPFDELNRDKYQSVKKE